MEKKLYDLVIDEELEHVMSPLSDIELELLTESLLSEGCRDPLVVWKGKIVDGHNRYRICQENNIPFTYIEIEFQSLSEAIVWILRNQLLKRNLNDYQKCEIVVRYEDDIQAVLDSERNTQSY